MIATTSCAKKNSSTAPTIDVGRRGADVTVMPFVNFNGMVRLSALGDKAVYISGKNLADSSLRVWRWDKGLTTQPDALATTANITAPNLVALSPDGKWISFVDFDASGTQTLYIQSFANAKLFAALPYDESEKGTIEQLNFSTNINNTYPLLAIQFRHNTSDNTPQNFIDIFSFVATQLAITMAQPVTISPRTNTSSLMEPHWLNDPVANQYVLLGWESTSSTHSIAQWTITLSSGTATASQETQLKSFSLDNGAIKSAMAAGGNEIAFIKELPYHAQTPSGTVTLEPFGDRAPDASGASTKGTVLIAEALGLFDTKKNSEIDLPSTQYQIDDVKASSDGLYLFALGSELIACQNADLYGKLILVHTTATQKNAHIVLVTNDDHSVWSISQNPCSIVTSADKVSLVVSRSEAFDLSVDSSSGTAVFKLAVQMVFDSTEKILLAQFGLNADLTLAGPQASILP